ncbi:MAG: hypothetical protein K0U52_13765, partial [Gammaproteobacteria bacterium]|nr:hypothetical protein [Gammaproteobacteria bacterium]
PLICYENDSFVVGQRAMHILEQLEPPLSSVAVAGLYRTGKSFLLNRVILQANAFDVGSTINACTKGVWMWSEPLITQDEFGNDIKVIVLDTEGIGATTADASHDTRIFSLALLLSSFFVYNSLGSIDEQALSNLSLVTNISKEIRVNAVMEDESTDVTKNESHFTEFFPAFLWVVRDFVLQLQDTNGNEINSEQYLEHALKDCTGKNAESKNRVRHCLKQFFPERGCVTLVRPCMDEKHLQNLNELPDEHLRPEFLEQAAQLRARVLQEAGCRPLTMKGKQLSGSMISFLCQAYTNAINQGSAPVIHDAWTYVCESQRMKAEQDLCDIFLANCGELASQNLLPPEFVRQVNKLQRETMFKYSGICVDLDYDAGDYQSDMETKLTNSIRSLIEQNEERFYQNCRTDALHDHDILIAFENYPTFESFRIRFGEQHTAFAENVLEPLENAPGLKSSAELEWFSRMLPIVWRAVSHFYGAHEHELDRLKNELLQLKTQMSEMAKTHGSEVQRLQHEHERALTQRGNEFASEVKQQKEKISELTFKLDDANTRMLVLEAEVVQSSHANTAEMGQLEQRLIVEQSRAESAESQVEMLRLEVEDLSEVDEMVKAKELELSNLMFEKEKLTQDLCKMRKEMDSRSKEFDRLSQLYKQEAQEIETAAVESVSKIKKLRKMDQQKMKRDIEEHRANCGRFESHIGVLKTELETINQQKLEAAHVYEEQLNLLRTQVSDSEARLSDSQAEHVRKVQEMQDQLRLEISELERKENSAKDKTMRAEKEWAQRVKDLETRCIGAEARLENQKRHLEQAQELNRRKKAKTENTENMINMVRSDAEVAWARKQMAQKDAELDKQTSRVRELEGRIREYERTADSKMTRLKLDYEARIAELEEEVANLT